MNTALIVIAIVWGVPLAIVTVLGLAALANLPFRRFLGALLISK
jgi:hypothetical protein